MNQVIKEKKNQNFRVFVVDDTAVDREIIALMLEEYGLQVTQVESGKDCLSKIEESRPDMILLDIMMPDMDGNALLEEVRRKYSQLELPIIMVTSKADASDVVHALTLGANDFITKPINFNIAFKRIQNQILMTQQAQVMSQTKELETIHAMIRTYNHEINNPLAIAIGNCELLGEEEGYREYVKEIKSSLWRISEILKKSEEILNSSSPVFTQYVEDSKMLNFKK